jgi:hypothetical protein
VRSKLTSLPNKPIPSLTIQTVTPEEFKSTRLKESISKSAQSRTPLSWSAKPFMKKTLVKFGIIFALITLFAATNYFLAAVWIFMSIIIVPLFVYYYQSKKSYLYHITDRSVKVEKSWIFGNYTRELTFDHILDIRVYQGILARYFDCGSLLFVTKTDLGRRRSLTPLEFIVLFLFAPRNNIFWDILEPVKARELLMKQLTEWRTVYQQQSIAASQRGMATSLGIIAGKAQSAVSMSEELTKLKNLYDNSTITKEEYEKAKQKLLS